jgi:hypothetical protein
VLQDTENLQTHKIEDGHMLHLVARPANAPGGNANDTPPAPEPPVRRTAGGGAMSLSDEVGRIVSGVLNSATNRREGVQPDDTTHIRQGLLSVRTIMSAIDQDRIAVPGEAQPSEAQPSEAQPSEVPPSEAGGEGKSGSTTEQEQEVEEDDNRGARLRQAEAVLRRKQRQEAKEARDSGRQYSASSSRFVRGGGGGRRHTERSIGVNGGGNATRQFVPGQWLDVRDTVNQWLEATILDVSAPRNQILVHYHGWPTRWDEWIDVCSERLLPFRAQTAHSASAPYPLLPTPDTPPAANSTAPLLSSSDVAEDIRGLVPEVYDTLKQLEPLMRCV